MAITRRWFSIGAMTVSLSAACGGGKDKGGTIVPEPASAPPDPPSDPQTLLIMGGTGFLGPHVVDAALAAGYEVTLFNRGKTNAHLFPELEKLQGDRNEDLAPLEGREFSAVIDTSGYFPRQVEASASLLAKSAEQYLFVSSISAYRDLAQHGLTETAATAPMPDPYSEKMPDNYGALKAACERAAEAAMPGRTTVVRPGLIVGPGDPTDRFTYWPVRVARGGRVLAPNDARDPVQYIDARDLATFMVHALKTRATGIYNTAGPGERTSIGALLDACRDVSGSDAEFVWAPTPFLAEHEVMPWMHLTVWVPPDDPEWGGMDLVDVRKAVAAGLRHRPVADSIADTLAWWNTLPQERREAPLAGLPAKRETEVLQALAALAAKSAP